MLIMDAPTKGSDICGRYKFKASSSDKDYVGSFNLCERCGRLEIWSFGIYGEHRGQGFGQQMMQEAIEVAKDRKLVLYVEKDNVIAIHVYEKCGFRISGKFMGDRAWVMTYVGEAESATNERELCCA
jgi:ribosomal protein S18 acetylase RimI-like enzyme